MKNSSGEGVQEDRTVVSISSHPGYRFREEEDSEILIEGELAEILMEPEYLTDGELEFVVGDGSDPLIGTSICWQCDHRFDSRALWKRTFLAADEFSYECRAVRRCEVADPVSGLLRYVEVTRTALAERFQLVEEPYPRCITLNPEGQCTRYSATGKNEGKSKKE